VSLAPDLLAIAARGVFAYVFLLALMRASGKRSVAEATAFDFVLALIMGDLIDDLLWGEVTGAGFVTASGVLCLAHALFGFAAYKSERFSHLIAGTPTVLMRNGKPVRAGMRQERMNESDLAAHLRIHGIDRDRWEDVAVARLEIDGELSVTKSEAAEELKKEDLA
jgi:uncharacterized membrane protein YcaP (DUF421 family)